MRLNSAQRHAAIQRHHVDNDYKTASMSGGFFYNNQEAITIFWRKVVLLSMKRAIIITLILMLLMFLVGGCSSKKQTAAFEPPATANGLYERMESFYKNKDYAQSKALFDELVAKFPDSQESAKAKALMTNINELVQNEAAIKKELTDKANSMNDSALKVAQTPHTPNVREQQSSQKGSSAQQLREDSFVAVSENTLEILNRFCANKNQAGVMRMIERGEVFSVAGGTRVTVLSRGMMVHRIEVDEGPMVGKRGYVPVEFVR